MKTPKEKAQELVDKFMDIKETDFDVISNLGTAKSCALVCINEMYEIAKLIETNSSKVSNFIIDVESEIKYL